MDSPILHAVPLGSQWPTLDPFLFCAHHLDAYPKSNGELGPDSALEGRTIGQDFAGLDGWNMYHGSSVPGFPQHPHRGFETVTYVRSGYCDHSDSLGAKARFGEGDMQWVTAGAGIVHSEMFPLLNSDDANPLHLFQIWLNLPAKSKMVEPYFSMYWDRDVPKYSERDSAGRSTSVTVLAGSFAARKADAPPPDSWAAKSEHDVQIWHLKLQADAVWTLPDGPFGSNRMLYLFDGDALSIGGDLLAADHGAALDVGRSLEVVAGSRGAECLLLQGQPISEPISQYGPFVMNSDKEIQQAIADYQRTRFGGWPWQSDDPTHGHEVRRFARYGSGREELG